MFFQFMLYSKVTQLYIYIHLYTYVRAYIYTHTYTHSFPPIILILFHHKWLDIVPCAIQQDLIAYPIQMQYFASTNPKLPVHPTFSLATISSISLATISFYHLSLSEG